MMLDFTNVTIYCVEFYKASYIEYTGESRVHVALKAFPEDCPVWVWAPRDQVAEWLFGSQEETKGAVAASTPDQLREWAQKMFP